MQTIVEFDLFDLEDDIKTVNFKLSNVLNRNKPKTDPELASLYLSQIRARHDLLHYFICLYLGAERKSEDRIGNIFDGLTMESSKLSPDIIKIEGNNIFIIEISVSKNPNDSEYKKTKKYFNLVEEIKRVKQNNFIYFIPFCVSSTLTDLELKVTELQNYPFDNIKKTGFWFQKFFVFWEMLDDLKEYVYKNIDKKYLDDVLINQFGDITEKAGIYKDLDINMESFTDVQSKKYKTDDIESFCDNQNINDYVEVLKSILEKDCVEDELIYNKMMDKKNNINQYLNSKNILFEKNHEYAEMEPKPSHHFFTPDYYVDDDLIQLNGLASEQKMIYNFFDYMIKNLIPVDDSSNFLMSFAMKFKNCFNNKDGDVNKNMFENGFYFNNEDDKNLRLKLFNVNKDKRNHKNLSYRQFLVDENKIFGENVCSTKKKIIKIDNLNEPEFHNFWKKTGISHTKHYPEEEKPKSNDRKSVNFSNSLNVDSIINWLSEEQQIKHNFKEDEYLWGNYEFDSDFALNMKKQYDEYSKPTFNLITSTRCYRYMKYIHLIAKQLMHFQLLNMSDKMFGTFNCGLPNMLIITAGCYNKLTSENGKPFIQLFVTESPDSYNNFFGKLYKHRLKNGKWLILTNWRRLPVFKITHIRDSYYSTLSSTMNSVLSAQSSTTYTAKKVVNTYVLRSIISCITSQKIAEHLMDIRYAYMSAFSSHTNIEKLLIEKYEPPYNTIFDVWLIIQTLTKLPEIFKAVILDGSIKIRIPKFMGKKRELSSLGGSLMIPSLWGDYNLVEPQEILDEAFIYVHTMKEPSNLFHEEVKAVKTILKFQDQFDSLTEKRKKGLLKPSDLKDFLLDDNIIGCCAPIIYNSTKKTIEIEKPNFKKYVDSINSESISEILSTKAVIHDLDRSLVVQEMTKKEINKIKNRYKSIHNKELTEEEINKLESYYYKSNSKYYPEKKPRQKVMETILDLMIDKKFDRTVNLANWFIEHEKGDVLADICIKSQYGSKREFYVINIGAKALARCCENFFKDLCKNSPNEAISIPGDIKLIKMQEMLDNAYYNMMTNNKKLKFVNGDCTKWSAAETMASFISMTYGLKEFIPIGMYNLIKTTFCCWADKEIQIPIDLIKKNIITSKTKYIKNLNSGRFRSTHNFLQGMFNYASSYKAVCCSNYTYHIWKEIYPDSTLKIYHMEHSDDYILIILYEKEQEFEKFRVLHKIMMKLHGYNDSDRKTSCQSFLMEFVSLMSYNGTMLYPHIKKSKEVNLNLPCTGYRSDMEAALSRVGECMRVGCNQSFLYFMQKLHGICVADAYSILPDMRNNCDRSIETLYKTPIELFGLSNTLPLFSLFCKGNINNYRLYHYGDESVKKQLIALYLIGKEINKETKYSEENEEYSYSLYNPRYYYEYDSQIIYNLRNNLDINTEQIEDFWKDHISYKFMKPKYIKHMIDWVKCMFFNRSFTEAYTKTSRTKMTMRISKFVSAKILKEYFTFEDMKNNLDADFLDLRTMINKIYNDITTIINHKLDNVEEKLFLKIISKSDPTPNTIYSYLNNIVFLNFEPKRKSPIAVQMPRKIKTYYIENQASIVLQRIFNYEDFMIDCRKVKSDVSIEKDIKTLFEIYGDQLKNRDTLNVMSIYNDIMINKESRMVMIGYDRNSKMLTDCLNDILCEANYPHIGARWSYFGEIRIKHPYTQIENYIKYDRLTPDLNKQNIQTLTLLFTYLKFKMKMTDPNIFSLFKKLKFQDPNDDINIDILLNRFDQNYIKDHDVEFTDYKIIAFLKQYYQHNTILSEELINTAYMYSYNYDKKANKVGDVWDGLTICTFNYMDKLFRFHQYNNENPLLIAETSPGGYIIPAYNVALKLSDKITEDQLKYDPHKDNLSSNKIIYDEKIELFCKEKHIHSVLEFQNGRITKKRLKTINYGDEIIPVFLTRMKITKIIGKKYDIRKYKPEIRGINMTSGRMKMFTLPFWRCKQHNTIRYDGVILVDGVDINDILKDNMLYKYFHDKEITYKKDIIITIEDYNDLCDVIKQERYSLKKYELEIIDVDEELKNLFGCSDVLELETETEIYTDEIDITDLDEMLGIDLSMGFMDENDFQEDNELIEPIGVLELDELLDDQDIEKEIDTLINTFGEIDFAGIKFLNQREKKVNTTMNYTLLKVNMRPKLSCYIEMCRNKTNRMKTCDVYSFIINLTKCVKLFCENTIPQKYYNLMAIREALRNTTIKEAVVLNYHMEINNGDFVYYESKMAKKTDEIYLDVINRTKNYQDFGDYIKFRVKKKQKFFL